MTTIWGCVIKLKWIINNHQVTHLNFIGNPSQEHLLFRVIECIWGSLIYRTNQPPDSKMSHSHFVAKGMRGFRCNRVEDVVPSIAFVRRTKNVTKLQLMSLQVSTYFENIFQLYQLFSIRNMYYSRWFVKQWSVIYITFGAAY